MAVASTGTPSAMAAEPAPTPDALSTPVPSLPLTEVRSLLERLWGLDGELTPLAGERDQNLHLATADGHGYVVKISNPSEPLPLVDLQIAALEHIEHRAPHQPVPRMVRMRDGRVRANLRLPDDSPSTVRLLTYLEGVQIRGTPRTKAQRVAMGAGLAALDIALRDFSHPAARHDLLWNVSTAHRLRAQLDGLDDPARRSLAGAFMARFNHHVLPVLASLRTQVIHNDYHLYNVLVSPHEPDRITGVIDFGDMVEAPLVGEVATAAAFHTAGGDDLFEGPAQFVGAYRAVLPLTDAEQEVVADLMATRHLVTALITEWRVQRYPENRAYIMRHNPDAWHALEHLADLPRHEARDRLLNPSSHGAPQ